MAYLPGNVFFPEGDTVCNIPDFCFGPFFSGRTLYIINYFHKFEFMEQLRQELMDRLSFALPLALPGTIT